jgi:hypothetical protein
VKIYM